MYYVTRRRAVVLNVSSTFLSVPDNSKFFNSLLRRYTNNLMD
jgi:hypothetical protein